MRDDWILEYAGTVLRFGTKASGYGLYVAADRGTQSVLTEDTETSAGDGLLFGADRIAPSPVAFELGIFAGTDVRALELLELARAAWRADALRSAPGAMASLRSENGRTTFGRPRRFSENTDLLHAGIIDIVADFQPVTDLWFGDEESVTVGLVPPPGGGLIAPLAAPLATTASSDRSQVVRVDGELATWPVVTIQGPITNPVIEVLGAFRWAFQLTLAYDQTLTVDARPWVRSILRDGAAVAGALTPRSTRLTQSMIPPGAREFVLRGTSAGTPSATLTHRPAFHTP